MFRSDAMLRLHYIPAQHDSLWSLLEAPRVGCSSLTFAGDGLTGRFQPPRVQGGRKVAAIIELHPVLAAGDVLYGAHTTLVGTAPFVDHYPVTNFEFLLGHF